jgi:hypothetical protein
MKKVKRYQKGGEAEGLSGTAGRMQGNKKPRTTDDMTFGQAFRAARNEGKGTFSWRGNKYTTETKAEKPESSAAKRTDTVTDTMSAGTKGGPSARRGPRTPPEAPKKKKTFMGALKARLGTAGQRKRGAEEGYKTDDIGKSIKAGLGTQRQREELADEYEGAKVDPMTVAGLAGGAAGIGGRSVARRLLGGRLAGGKGGESLAQRRIREAADKEAERVGRGVSRRGMPSYSDRYRAGESAAARRAEFRQRQRDEAERRLDERLASDMEGGFKNGGSIKKYNKGGKIDGVAKRGKTRCRII